MTPEDTKLAVGLLNRLLEQELAGIDYGRDSAHARKVSERHAVVVREVELLETRWLELSERLESLNG